MNKKQLQEYTDGVLAGLRPDQPEHTEKQIAIIRDLIGFYTQAFLELDFEEAQKYISKYYIQHGATAAADPAGVWDLARRTREESGGHRMEFHYRHFFVDGNYVICHMKAVRAPGDLGLNVYDIFKFNDEGKFIEHWDAMVDVPPPQKMMHQNTLF